MNLFQTGSFKLASGRQSSFKIECDALTDEDWKSLAKLASELLPAFGVVEGVPRGGLKFAEELQKYSRACACSYPHQPHDWCQGKPLPLLVVDDVWTTGGSFERHCAGRDALGCVVFSRGLTPPRVIPLFQLRTQ